MNQKSDELYVIDLCDSVLNRKARRQQRFDFLRCDPGRSGVCVQLPVDAYYDDLSLVVEYWERQHILKYFGQSACIIYLAGVSVGHA